MRVLALVTDAFGGRGGIAKFNRDFLSAIAADPRVAEVTVVPRVVRDADYVLPPKVRHVAPSDASKSKYLWRATRSARVARADVVLCGHLNLLPVAATISLRRRTPLLVVAHGVEAWTARGPFYRMAVRRAKVVVSVSEFTRDRLAAWSGAEPDRIVLIPNSVDLQRYGVGPKRGDLLARHGLAGRSVLLTIARMTVEDRYKGIDEVLEVLPGLIATVPDIAYLVVGDGDDRQRLIEKAARLGLADRVVFAGYVPEVEKADYIRLADAFVMPGRGEGFGIVYLEALACGVPVIASALDASREAVLNGKLGQVVNPDDRDELRAAVLAALSKRERRVPEGLEHFSTPRFEQRVRALLDRAVAGGGP